MQKRFNRHRLASMPDRLIWLISSSEITLGQQRTNTQRFNLLMQQTTEIRWFATRRTALTIVELLVVVGLLTILATFSLGAMRGLLRSQKVTQASTLVKQYLQNAQIRAITNGRPVAVFMDRVSIIGDRSVPSTDPLYDCPIASNYTVTRLQFGEVFPPYVGDVLNAVGTLRDVPFSSLPTNIPGNPNPIVTTRPADGHADELWVPFGVADTGFGAGGFISPGDLIGFEGFDGLFRIEEILLPTPPVAAIRVRFFNPPAQYNQLYSLKNLADRNPTYEVGMSAFAPRLPLPSGSLDVRFRVYRQPTKSLVGAIALPRGTCIDLSLSGMGPWDNASVGGTFKLFRAPSNGMNPSPADYSRIGIVFDAQGRASYLIFQTRGSNPYFAEINSNLYLMVGRTDQVLPGLQSTPANQVLEAQSQASLADGSAELPPSNLQDTENVWISCNPFTGEVKSSPVSQFMTDMSIAEVQDQVRKAVRDARSAAIAGLTN